MERQKIVEYLNDRLQLNINTRDLRHPEFMYKWHNLVDRISALSKEVKIVLVGKYTKLEDSYASVLKALQHASIKAGYRLSLGVSYYLLISFHFKPHTISSFIYKKIFFLVY